MAVCNAGAAEVVPLNFQHKIFISSVCVNFRDFKIQILWMQLEGDRMCHFRQCRKLFFFCKTFLGTLRVTSGSAPLGCSPPLPLLAALPWVAATRHRNARYEWMLVYSINMLITGSTLPGFRGDVRKLEKDIHFKMTKILEYTGNWFMTKFVYHVFLLASKLCAILRHKIGSHKFSR